MTLVDTSVWVELLRSGNRILVSLLEREQVMTQPFVIGELACSQIRNRREIHCRGGQVRRLPAPRLRPVARVGGDRAKVPAPEAAWS